MIALLRLNCLALGLLLCALPPAALAASGDTTKTAKIAKTGKVAQQKSTKLKIVKSETGESPADRGRRMQRECRGLPNAGACRGYGYGS